MSTLVIGDVCSRIRSQLKAQRQDSFLTDRTIYNFYKKHAALSIKRLDEKKRLTAFASIFETLDKVDMKVIDKVEASECGVAPKSYSTISVTCMSIPVFMEGIYGPMIRSITSLDGSEVLKLTTPDEYNRIAASKNFKFNTQKYAWWLNDRIYAPNLGGKTGVPWPAIRIEAMVNEDISAFKCNYDQKCQPRQEHSLNIPDYLLAEIEANVIKDFAFMLQAPEDDTHNNQNALR